MKKLLAIILSTLMITNSHALLIQAQETKGKFVKSTETLSGYKFSECEVTAQDTICTDLLGDTEFTRADLNDLSDQNSRKVIYAAAGDAAAVVGGFFIGFYVGVVGSAAYISASHGAAYAGYGFFLGAVPGTTLGGASTISLDILDPFIYRDTAIAFDAIIGVADEGDLEDVDSYIFRDEAVVVIEDLNFSQLKDRLVDQLADIKDLDVEDFQKSALY